jgi:hypothetical protein
MRRGLVAVAALARDLDKLNRKKKLGSAVRSRIMVFCWLVRGKRLDAGRTRALARELRRGARLRRPYALPVRERSGISDPALLSLAAGKPVDTGSRSRRPRAG